jgi:hypothetical protein
MSRKLAAEQEILNNTHLVVWEEDPHVGPGPVQEPAGRTVEVPPRTVQALLLDTGDPEPRTPPAGEAGVTVIL